ncbi:MAG: GAF domain-containing sensor histidine kinase [Chloroflexota bacterium]|nr:GAF domain-containing sensor histidine kinase [Chloroflexota bacterium]
MTTDPPAGPSPATVTGFDIVTEIACTINSVLDLDQLYRVIYEQCSRVLDTANFWIGRSANNGRTVEAVLWFQGGVQTVTPGQTLPIITGLNREVLHTRRTLRVDSYAAACAARGLPANLPLGDDSDYCWIGVPMVVGDRLIGIISNSRRYPFTLEEARLLEAIAALCAVAIENAALVQLVSETAQDLMRRSQELYVLNNHAGSANRDLERRTRELAGINAVATALNRSLDLTTMLDQAATAVCDVTGWDSAAMRLWNPLTRRWDLVVRRTGDSATDDTLPLPPGQNEADLYTPLTPDLLAGRPRAFQVGRQWSVVSGQWSVIDTKYTALHDDQPGVETRIAFPIAVRTETLGMLELGVARPIALAEVEARLTDLTLRGICEQLALAIENARLYAAARQVAALEERQHLARELHDSVTQSLFTVTLMAEAAQAMVERDPSQVGRYLSRLQATAGAALGEMRALLAQLRPTAVGASGLGAALRRHAETLREQWPLEIAVEVDPHLGSLSPAVEDGLYRITQEALHNVIKHAAAESARVRLAQTVEPGAPPGLLLTIEDDGHGFDPSRPADVGHGLGLIGMRERASALGGHLTVESRPGHGSRVVVAVPT